MRIVFFGTPDFAAGTLSYLIDQGYSPVAVVTRTDKPKGRSGTPAATPVKELAEKKLPGVPIYQPEKASAPSFIDELASLSPDLFVVVAYGEIMSQQLLDLPKIASVNVHASLLPEYRGAAPIQRAIMDGKTKSGVTIMHMAKKMDAGDIIRSASTEISQEMTAGELYEKLREIGQKELVLAVRDMEKGILPRIPQDESKVTYAKKIELEDCEVLWNNQAQDLHNLIRGTTPFPGAWCWILVKGEKKRLKILGSRVVNGSSGTPGTIASFGEKFIISCGKDSLELIEVKPEGKKAMKGSEFCRGIRFSDISLII